MMIGSVGYVGKNVRVEFTWSGRQFPRTGHSID